MITRCYFNKNYMIERSIDTINKELIVNFVGNPPIQDHYDVVIIDDHNEPNKINLSYDSAFNESKIFRKWSQERFDNVNLISKMEVADGIHAKFSYTKMWNQ